MAEARTTDGGAELRIDGADRTPHRSSAPGGIPRHGPTTSGGSRAASSGPRDRSSELTAEQRVEIGTRGSLEVRDRAVERIAAAATLEVAGVAPAGTSTSSLGNALGRAYPRVDVQVAGRRARAHVEIVTHWPHPAARIAAAVREHVSDRLHALADLEVDAVQVDVARVVRPGAPERRRVQ